MEGRNVVVSHSREVSYPRPCPQRTRLPPRRTHRDERRTDGSKGRKWELQRGRWRKVDLHGKIFLRFLLFSRLLLYHGCGRIITSNHSEYRGILHLSFDMGVSVPVDRSPGGFRYSVLVGIEGLNWLWTESIKLKCIQYHRKTTTTLGLEKHLIKSYEGQRQNV